MIKFDTQDFRKNQTAKLQLDEDKLQAAAQAAGVKDGAFIKLRIKDGNGKLQGLCQALGGNVYRLTVHVLPRASYEDAQHYVLNNSLVHELRHVAQNQEMGSAKFSMAYDKANKTFGYAANKYEVEARHFGRLADHTGTKRPDALGKAVWAIIFA